MAEGGEFHSNSEINSDKLQEEAMDFEELQEKAPVAGTSETEVKGEDADLQRFLQKLQSDRMYELRQIQLGERPVTKTDHKDKIDSFFTKRLEAQAATQGKENIPLNTDNVEEHRPDTVVVEIQGLVQQQRVSNVLSTHFRRHLENIIRGSISSVTRNSPRPTPSPRTASPSPRPTPAPRTGSPLTQTTTVEPDQENDQRSRSNSNTSLRSSSSSNTSSFVSVNAENVPSPENIPVAPNVPEIDNNHQETRPLTLDEMQELQREEIVQEISELVHRGLVSTTLAGEFRNVLELTIRDRVEATGTDGERVQEYIQSIRQSQPHIRNDFSNLGIPNQGQTFDNWDNVSVTSVSATAVPYTQSNLYLSREIQSLKSQLEEMRNMMRVSFDLQLDIQRAIRQEVAAAVSQAKGGVEEHLGAGTSVKSRPVNDTHCIICLDNHSDCVLYQCGHMCVCYTCGRNLVTRGSKCPVCRAPIKDVIRAYRSSDE